MVPTMMPLGKSCALSRWFHCTQVNQVVQVQCIAFKPRFHVQGGHWTHAQWVTRA